MESDSFIRDHKALQKVQYYGRNMYKNRKQYVDLIDELNMQKIRAQSWWEMEQAQQVLKTALESQEEIQMDMIYDSIDQFNFAINIAQEKDIEVEAIASAFLGRIFYRCFHKNEKALSYFKQSKDLCESLKPKTFNLVEWYKNMIKDLDAIQKESM